MEASSSNAVEEKVREDGFKALEGKNFDSIGIEKFLQGKVIFITGATGFLAKVLVEKILRATPDVSKIYLMIRAKDKEAALRRLKTEILDAELFKCVKEKYGKDYEAFMMSKLVPVVGNASRSDLGMEEESANAIKKNLHIIVNSAANTSFFPRYDETLDINAMGPYHLMNFAKKCFKLELFLHISTAYVNVPRKESIIFMEEKLSPENFITGREIQGWKSVGRFLPALILENEKKLVTDCKKTLADDVISKKMKELGLQRRKEFGFPNTYTFAKAMGEMVVDMMRGDIPVVIMRPAVVESSCQDQDPFPGWIEGNKTTAPLAMSYGKGKVTGLPGNPDTVMDLVPVDMVVNATLAAMARHGVTRKPDINIYHVSSSILNPLTMQNMFGLFYENFKSSPWVDKIGKPIDIQKLNIFSSMEDFEAHLLREATVNCSNSSPSEKVERRKSMKLAKNMAKVYEPFFFYNYRFSTSNTQRLLESMSEVEKKKFGFDLTSIEWKDYIVKVHVPGLRRHARRWYQLGIFN